MSKLQAEWKNDCQGKKDYDAKIVHLSTRYWPRGGGFSIFDSATGEFQHSDARPEIKPSATASILLNGDDEYEEIVEANFEADTESEVKALVEKWAQEQFDKIEKAIRSIYAQQTEPR